MKRFESFGLDPSNECLWQNGVQISLPPKPFAVLRYLVENPGRLITHDELLDAVWPETFVQPQVLRTYMLDLRKVLGDDAKQPRFIQTKPKRGFRFVAAVSETNGAAPDSATPAAVQNAAVQNATVQDARVQDATVQDSRAAGIVGREADLERLQAQLQVAAGGARRVVFITGETGIGKTALVDEFCRRLGTSTHATLARGQCVEGFGLKDEYYPVKEALTRLCASADGERACNVLAKVAPAWLASVGRRSDAEDLRSAALELTPGDLCAALEELAAENLLILIFEDLHWADRSTLNLISALARRRAQARLLILATCNISDGATEQAPKGLKSDLAVRRLCEEIALEPLTKAEVRKLLHRELRQEALPAGLDSFVLQRSEGNPLFVISILEHLIAQRFLVRNQQDGAAAWDQAAPFREMEAEVPGELEQMIELEIQRLSPGEQRMLEAASLTSVAFPAWAVAAALEENVAETEEACEEMARRLYFVERAGQDELPDGSRSAFYVFAHGLYREVLYRRQAATRRARRHVRIAERLGELFAGREASVAREMAMHFESAGEWQRTAGALRAAAQHAIERQAYSNAAELLEHALRIAGNLAEMSRSKLESEIRAELLAVRDAA